MKPDTKEGIDHAKQLDLVSSGMADIYISQLLAYSTTALFDSSHTARMIAMFRHPTKRIIDLFYYQQRATWEPNYDITMATMTLEEFAASEKMIDNFMVRSLLDILSTSEITMQHVAVAKEILRRKFVIGITEWYEQVSNSCRCSLHPRQCLISCIQFFSNQFLHDSQLFALKSTSVGGMQGGSLQTRQ